MKPQEVYNSLNEFINKESERIGIFESCDIKVETVYAGEYKHLINITIIKKQDKTNKFIHIKSAAYDDLFKSYIDVKERIICEINILEKMNNFKQERRKEIIEKIN